MLDFVTRLFLRVAPNNTAWCAAVEDYLRSQSYKLRGEDPLRRQFGNALQWFNSLQHAVEVHIKSLLEETRTMIRSSTQDFLPGSVASPHTPQAVVEQIEDAESPGETRHRYVSDVDIEFLDTETPSASWSRKRDLDHDNDTANTGEGSHTPLDRPSEYLRSRCPVCFGGNFNPDEKRLNWSDVIVCLDTNFTQRHQSGCRDPVRTHPDSFFLSEEEVREVESRVEAAHDGNTRPTKKAKPNEASFDEDDKMEPGMRVSKAVLDLCGGSFTAAHEYIAKVVSAGYDVTGLMALLCHHDRPLFVVNMTSPGEQQHYAIALLEKLFQHLPSFIEVTTPGALFLVQKS
ncbi:hypothetical protein VKT23_006165 [Stygiomarasmius scandens]|uniref:Uncharacterized protein n=1 Tax=Marasmiellus scandens TaxID=2682957 RepID=A0ABR1JSQ3_9AGAR